MALTPSTSHLLIMRKNGKSATRRQRRYKSDASLELGIARARAQGFNTFWAYGPAPTDEGARPLLRQWSDRHVDHSTCGSCGRAITHGGTAALAAAPQWYDEDDDFVCPDGEHEHRPSGDADE